MSDFIPNLADAGSNNGIGDSSNLNVYGSALANFNVETNILTYTVTVGQTLSIDSIEVWGDYFAEWFVRINGVQVGGTNMSAAERSKTLQYGSGPVPAAPGDVVTVSVQHQYMGAVKFHANLMGRLS